MMGLTPYVYLVSAILFILGLQGLSSARTAVRGNRYAIVGMVIALVATVWQYNLGYEPAVWCALAGGALIGLRVAQRIPMTALPQLVAAFHSLVGLAAVYVAMAAFINPVAFNILDHGHIPLGSLVEMGCGLGIGALTFTGSLVAFGKLQGFLRGAPLRFLGQHYLNFALGIVLVVSIVMLSTTEHSSYFTMVACSGLALGFLLVLPIGGADMPVIVSMLNSYSGWAAAGIGFTLHNDLLVIVGALVGSSGAILSYIMCKGMNRSFISVILGGAGTSTSAQAMIRGDRTAQSGAPQDAAFIMENAQDIIVVPGYGMAVAQAQHALREMVSVLREKGARVRFAIHPVAGRMPGHMNVLLAEANISYEDVFELDDINSDFGACDVAFVIGANDVTNPAARTDSTSPIFGMPILDVDKAKTILFVKRSLSPGYAGIQNELFFHDKTMMLYGDAKKVCEEITKSVEGM
ncbi:MAG: NAD(P)(+) transhydrogenase (Re/Si-specific) subunit beta [Alphaproteobacteria bacterium]|nr:MAG: NAD(P)(+) transhydrogenase (Re/Si-specific) subunit beta [Alphaproteobacteria bacterium]